MYLMQKVGNRQAGMGLNIVKFQAILQMAEGMIKFGVPMNFGTGSDEESGHKATKTAAVVQKRKDRFDGQVGRRLSEIHALQIAHEELKHGRCLRNITKCDIDLVESSSRRLQAAPDYIGHRSSKCRFFGQELQSWQPTHNNYSILWIQHSTGIVLPR